MASGAYPPALDCVTGAVDYDTDTFYVMLLAAAYTPNFDTHTRRSDLTNEVANSGTYAAGGDSVTVTVASFNARARRAVESLGFERVGSFAALRDGREFEVLVRAERPQT